MATPIQTPSFGSIPPFAKHSVTVHMPGWDNLLKFSERDPEIMAKIKNMYPRMLLHRDIAEVSIFSVSLGLSQWVNLVQFSFVGLNRLSYPNSLLELRTILTSI